MENIEDSVSEDFKEKFNTGYIYSKKHPELSEKILISNTHKNLEEQQISALLAGMREYMNSPEKNRLNQLNDIRNPQEGEKEHDIEK